MHFEGIDCQDDIRSTQDRTCLENSLILLCCCISISKYMRICPCPQKIAEKTLQARWSPSWSTGLNEIVNQYTHSRFIGYFSLYIFETRYPSDTNTVGAMSAGEEESRAAVHQTMRDSKANGNTHVSRQVSC